MKKKSTEGKSPKKTTLRTATSPTKILEAYQAQDTKTLENAASLKEFKEKAAKIRVQALNKEEQTTHEKAETAPRIFISPEEMSSLLEKYEKLNTIASKYYKKKGINNRANPFRLLASKGKNEEKEFAKTLMLEFLSLLNNSPKLVARTLCYDRVSIQRAVSELGIHIRNTSNKADTEMKPTA